MINFFRKIRKQLADDNKPLKYMRYAIGEIVLVVIGILIALQINNWNTKRVNINSYNTVLESLITDLENDVVELNNLVLTSKNQNNIIVKVLNKENTNDETKLEYIKELCYSPESFTPNTTSFKILENFGSSDLLKLKEVSTDVQSLYNSASKINQQSYSDRNALISTKIRPHIMSMEHIAINLNGDMVINNNEFEHALFVNENIRGPLKELFVLNNILITERLEPLKEKFKNIASKLKQLKQN